MNMIAENLIPNDEQIACVHLVGVMRTVKTGTVVINQYDADMLDRFGGLQFTFCPICGCRLEVAAKGIDRETLLRRINAEVNRR